MNTMLITGAITFLVLLVGIPIIFAICRFFGLYTIIRERQVVVYVLFGNVIGQISEPGLHSLWKELGWKASRSIETICLDAWKFESSQR